MQAFDPREPPGTVTVGPDVAIPKTKQAHMSLLKKNLGIDYSKVLFYDDFNQNKRFLQGDPSEPRPIKGIGVYVQKVQQETGMSIALVDAGIKNWRTYQTDPNFEQAGSG